MRIKALKYRNENNQDIIIIVDFYENFPNIVWKVADIKYKMKSQKLYRCFSETFCEDYNYLRLNSKEKEIYALHKYYEFVGKEKIEEALLKAWEAFKPDLDKIEADDI